jgi:uncharacterized protein (TIGR03000 family)
MYRRWQLWLGIPALALASLLFTTSSASAQRWGRGGWGNSGWGNSGYGFNNGFYGNGFNNGYYGNGFNNGYYGNGYGNNWYGRGYYGNPYSGNNGYYSNWSSPSYADYEPNYYYGQQPNYQQQGYTSFYPQQQHQMPQNAAMVHVHLPRNAELWFGGDKTTQTGSERDFVTPELKGDKDYFYTLKARWTDQDGKQVEQTRRVKVHANSHAMVDFFRHDQNTDTSRERTTTTPERGTPTTNPAPVRDTTTPAPRTTPAPDNNKP